MSGAAVRVDDKDFQLKLKKLKTRMSNLTPVMETIGDIVKTSVIENFEEGGRYSEPDSWKGGSKRWEALSPETLAQKKNKEKILIEERILMGSINYRASSDSVEIGSNKVYAAIHHFGGQAGRGLSVEIPARPIFVVQDENMQEINEALNDFLMEG